MLAQAVAPAVQVQQCSGPAMADHSHSLRHNPADQAPLWIRPDKHAAAHAAKQTQARSCAGWQANPRSCAGRLTKVLKVFIPRHPDSSWAGFWQLLPAAQAHRASGTCHLRQPETGAHHAGA